MGEQKSKETQIKRMEKNMQADLSKKRTNNFASFP